ncbi:MAG TPA: tail fiber protein [Anaerolineae bacterium]|nr:tail fiber protein [Anaerolineae bacterium]
MPATPYIGQIMAFGGNFAPQGWALCDGSLLPISQYETLFSLIGTTYGGDGQNTFALPDLRGRVPLHQGQGPGLSSYSLGQSGGAEAVTLTTGQLPAHSHPAQGHSGAGDTPNPAGAVWAGSPNNIYTAGATANTAMAATSISASGGSQPHNNMLPYLTLTFCIATEGIYPSQS